MQRLSQARILAVQGMHFPHLTGVAILDDRSWLECIRKIIVRIQELIISQRTNAICFKSAMAYRISLVNSGFNNFSYALRCRVSFMSSQTATSVHWWLQVAKRRYVVMSKRERRWRIAPLLWSGNGRELPSCRFAQDLQCCGFGGFLR